MSESDKDAVRGSRARGFGSGATPPFAPRTGNGQIAKTPGSEDPGAKAVSRLSVPRAPATPRAATPRVLRRHAVRPDRDRIEERHHCAELDPDLFEHLGLLPGAR